MKSLDFWRKKFECPHYIFVVPFHDLVASALSHIGKYALWFQLEDMFQLIVTHQGIEKITIQLKDTPTKVYAIGAEFFFIKGAPRSASKLSIDPINSHASYFGKSTGSNKRSVPIYRTVSFNWHQRVSMFL